MRTIGKVLFKRLPSGSRTPVNETVGMSERSRLHYWKNRWRTTSITDHPRVQGGIKLESSQL